MFGLFILLLSIVFIPLSLSFVELSINSFFSSDENVDLFDTLLDNELFKELLFF